MRKSISYVNELVIIKRININTKRIFMKTRMKSVVFKDETVVIDHLERFNRDEDDKVKIDLNPDLIKGNVTNIHLNGIHLISKELSIENGFYAVEIEHDFSFIKLHFEMEGDNQYVPDNAAERTIYIPGGHYNLFYLPKIKGELRYKTSKRKTLEITFTEAYLRKLFYPNFELTVPFLAEAIVQHKAFTMWETSKSISPQLYGLIEDILQCNYSGKIKTAYLESKVVEILSHLFSLIIRNDNTEDTILINETDFMKIQAVEQILKSRFREKHSLKSIAAEVGLNDFKIKKYFKIVFGTTVFSYLTQIKMEYAKMFLLENNCTIAEVSEGLGYKNQHHFTNVFKKTFGYLPSKLK